MIDTVILEIRLNYLIIDYRKFGTSKEAVNNNPHNFYKWTNNPTAKDKKDGFYKPRLTLIKRGGERLLKIEFSAPKLIFNNNLEELHEKDFPLVVEKLRERMKDMGVMVFSQFIEKADVVSFHPSKNIRLNNGFTSTFVIRELSKVDISQKFDIDIKDYRNCGQSLQFYTRLYSICIYDKANDFLRPKRRAIDKDQTRKQKDIFEIIKKKDPFFEILRIEIRIVGKRKINELLTILGFNKSPIFSDIFKTGVCQKVVNNCWERIFDNNLFTLIPNNNPQKVLESVLIKNPKIRTIKAIDITGLILLIRDKEGVRGLRQIIDRYKPKKTNWHVVKRYLRGLDKKIDTEPLGFIGDIEDALDDFKPLKIGDLSCKEL
jgi:hypothetical protein